MTVMVRNRSCSDVMLPNQIWPLVKALISCGEFPIFQNASVE